MVLPAARLAARARNWIGGGGELDLVFSRWRTLLVVEVRFRASGAALQSVDAEKLARTFKASRALIRGFHLQRYHLRVDLAAVDTKGRVTIRPACRIFCEEIKILSADVRRFTQMRKIDCTSIYLAEPAQLN